MSDQEWPSAPGGGRNEEQGDQGSTPPPSEPPPSTPPPAAPPAQPSPQPPPAAPPPAPPPASGSAGVPGTAPGAQAADLGTRFLARLIDWVLLWIVYAILWAIIFAAIVADSASGNNMMSGFVGGFSFVGILLSLIPGAYFAGMLVMNDGQTLGKKFLKLQVRTTDGAPLDMGRALRREWWNFLLVVPFIGGLATAGIAIFIAVTINNRQPWHDQQAGTYEVKTG